MPDKATDEGKFARDYDLKDQVRRAAVSSMSNLAEGFERGGLLSFGFFQSRRARALNCERNCTLLSMLDTWIRKLSNH